LPYLKDRPESLNRFPNGIRGESFYQKDVKDMPPEWVKKERIFSESNDDYINYLVCQDEATLIYLANLGCIEINPWFSRIKKLDNPDFIVIDLDPLGVSFDKVKETALAIKEVLDKGKIAGYTKTSGATGMHIYIPANAKYKYDITRDFAHLIARLAYHLAPEITSVERRPAKRAEKVYIDYLQNSKGQTIAAPYSLRPKPHAPVSTPIEWKEIKSIDSPEEFNIKTIHKRLQKKGDIFKGVLGKGIDIAKCIKNLEA
jgi:bifunctional non-homologous end joining protein LigD